MYVLNQVHLSEVNSVFVFLLSPSAAILSTRVFQILSGIHSKPAENESGSNRMEKVPSSKSRRSAKVQIEGAIREGPQYISCKQFYRVSYHIHEHTLRKLLQYISMVYSIELVNS